MNRLAFNLGLWDKLAEGEVGKKPEGTGIGEAVGEFTQNFAGPEFASRLPEAAAKVTGGLGKNFASSVAGELPALAKGTLKGGVATYLADKAIGAAIPEPASDGSYMGDVSKNLYNVFKDMGAGAGGAAAVSGGAGAVPGAIGGGVFNIGKALVQGGSDIIGTVGELLKIPGRNQGIAQGQQNYQAALARHGGAPAQPIMAQNQFSKNFRS